MQQRYALFCKSLYTKTLIIAKAAQQLHSDIGLFTSLIRCFCHVCLFIRKNIATFARSIQMSWRNERILKDI